MNFLAPAGLELVPHPPDPDRWKMMDQTTVTGRPFDYWAGLVDFPAGSTLLHFSLALRDPGDYPVWLKIDTQDVYGERKWDATIRVREAPSVV